MLSEHARKVVERLLRDRITPAAQTTDIWSVCESAAAQLPEKLARELAAEYLADVWLKPGHEASVRKPRKKYTPRTLDADTQARLNSDLADIDRRFWDGIGNLVNDFKVAMRAEITAELLAQPFALADGSLVTWGQATAEQHRQASTAHGANAATELESAARHEAAIDLLDESGADRLDDCAGLAA